MNFSRDSLRISWYCSPSSGKKRNKKKKKGKRLEELLDGRCPALVVVEPLGIVLSSGQSTGGRHVGES